MIIIKLKSVESIKEAFRVVLTKESGSDTDTLYRVDFEERLDRVKYFNTRVFTNYAEASELFDSYL